MRLWSLDPKYLDAKGLVALWREGLLAKKVLQNQTRGYKNHPQLERFKKQTESLVYINAYLHGVCDEADQRGYQFDRSKLQPHIKTLSKILVKSGQVEYEWSHLLKKLKLRSPKQFAALKNIKNPDAHPLFKAVPGGVEEWEVLSD